MAGEDDESGDKQYEPSQRKLEKAREKGDIARSADLVSASVMLGLVLGLTMAAGTIVQTLGETFVAAFEVGPGTGAPPAAGLREMIGQVVPILAILLVASSGLALVSAGVTQGIRFAPEKLKPDLKRLNPIKGLGQKLGKDALMTFGLGQLKLWTLIIVAIVVYGRWAIDQQALMVELEPAQFGLHGGGMVLQSLAVFGGIIGIYGAADFMLQRWRFRIRMMMSRKELTDEHKESEGDPHFKGQRRQKGQELALNRMMADVPDADVIIVNPTHYAVALKWSRKKGSVPVCVAKGTDEVAARIRHAAQVAGVPIHRDPPTARAIHATVPIGREILPDHYQAVALAIRFAETMRRKARRRIV